MTASRAKLLAGFLIFAAFAAPAGISLAQNDGRDASFLPPASQPPTALVAPEAITLPPVQVPVIAPPVVIAAPPPVTSAPSAAVPVAAPVATVPPVIVTPPVTVIPPPAPVAVTAPVVPPPVAAPTDLGTIDPESIGLYGPTEGGLGAAMWKGTPRLLAERILPSLSLPSSSPALNNLARRFLLTTASVPEGKPAGESLIAMRAEKLVALGDAADAWKLAMLAKPGQIDDISLRLVGEAALLSPVRDDVCAKLPEVIKTHSSPEWQKSLLVCQLRTGDTKAAQLTLDLLHTQGVKDENFFYIAEKNVMIQGKQLPRQLTPLKPLTLALMRLTDLPMPGEIYMRPDAALIPELLQGKPREEVTRWGLAERAAERGLIDGTALAAAYAASPFPAASLPTAANSPETGPRLRALLYQAALSEKEPAGKIVDAAKFMQSASPALLNGAGASVLAEMIKSIPASADYNASSGMIAHIYVLAGKADAAIEWLKIARHAAIGMPPVEAELKTIWPMTVFAGLESAEDYPQDLSKWIDGVLKVTDPKADNHDQRDQAAQILLLLDAAGFAVTEEEWSRVLDTPAFERHVIPQAALAQRLVAAGETKRRGEAALLALALTSGAGAGNDMAFPVVADAVRALRQAGLTADAAGLAREAAALVMAPAHP